MPPAALSAIAEAATSASPASEPVPIAKAAIGFEEDRLQELPPAMPATAASHAAQESRDQEHWQPIEDAQPPTDMPRPAALPANLEERIGSRLFIWIGGVALALAGGFLVKYSIDSGLLTPRVRVVLGLLLGAVFLAGGEWMRSRSSRIGQALTAAGVASLYASLFAAVALYQLLGQSAGFLLLVAVTAATIALSLRQGPFIGLVGLAGGFLTPAIVGSGEPNAGVLFGFLFLLQAGSQLLARRRGWWWIAAVSIAGGLVWVLLWMAVANSTPQPVGERIWVLLFLAATALLSAWSSRPAEGAAGAVMKELSYTAIAAQAATIILAAAMVSLHGFAATEWIMFGLLGAFLLALARFRPIAEPLPVLAALLGLLLLAVWPETVNAFVGTSVAAQLGNAGFFADFVRVALPFGALFAAGAFLGLWGVTNKLRWAVFSVYASAAYFLVAWWRLQDFGGVLPWGAVSLMLAALHLFAAERALRRRRVEPAYNDVLAVYALGVTGFVALAIGLELESSWMAIAWSLQLPAMAWIEQRLDIRWLRRAAWVGAGLVMVRLVPDPLLFRLPVGETPILNGLLYGYGIPLAGFVAAATLFRRRSDDNLVRALEFGAALLGFKLVTFEIRHAFHGPDVASTTAGLGEFGSLIGAWLVAAVGVLVVGTRKQRPALVLAGQVLVAIAGVALIGGPLLGYNPLLQPLSVGEVPIFDLVMFAYGLPALLLAVIARVFVDQGKRPWALAAGGTALLLGLLALALEIRRLFHGPVFYDIDLGLGELGTLVVAWLVIGLVLQVVGGWLRRPMLLIGARVVYAIAAVAIVFGLLLPLNPLLSPQGVGATPILDLVMFCYGMPALLLAISAGIFSSRDERQPALNLGTLALVMAMAALTIEIRRLFHGPIVYGADVGLAEMGTLVVAWLLAGMGLLGLSDGRARPTFLWAARAVLGVGVGGILFGLLLACNPLLHPLSVGGLPIVNSLLLAYAAPALLMMAAARLFAGRGEQREATVAGVLAILLGLVWLSLEVRHWFQGAYLDGHGVSDAETYTYSAAWLLYGVALLAAGIAGGGRALRYASLAVVVIAVGKVFLIDAAALTGLYRVFSFLGLGLCLLALGYVYQRFVFRRVESAAPA